MYVGFVGAASLRILPLSCSSPPTSEAIPSVSAVAALSITPTVQRDPSVATSRPTDPDLTGTTRADPGIFYPRSWIRLLVITRRRELTDLLVSLFDQIDAHKGTLEQYAALEESLRDEQYNREKLERKLQDMYASAAPYVTFVQEKYDDLR